MHGTPPNLKPAKRSERSAIMSYLDDLVNGGAAACSADAGEEAQSPAHVVRNKSRQAPSKPFG